MSEQNMELFQAAPLSQRFNLFLFDDSFTQASVEDDVIALLTPEKFNEFLDIAIDNCLDDDPTMVRAISRIVTSTNVEFIEPVTNEEELSRLVTKAENGISSFIEENTGSVSVELLSDDEVRQIQEIYNINNMLAFAKELSTRKEAGLAEKDMDMIFRYRNVLHRLNERRQIIRLAEMATASESVDGRVGYRTWGGDFHPYGFEQGGKIDSAEYVTFEGVQDDPGVESVEIAGIKIRIAGGRHESV